jgi:serine/threonine protein kinase
LETLRELNHPHLIKAMAYYTRERRHYVTYPWANGNLQDYWNKDPRKLYHSYVTWFFAQLCGICDGIDRLHSYGVDKAFRYGDIKPENILYFSGDSDSTTERGNEGMFVIADTGLSKEHHRLT